MRRGRTFLVAALVALGIVSAACGKKGVPKAPQWVRPKPVEGLRGGQRGDSVVLSLAAPKTRTDGSPFVESVVLRLMLISEPGSVKKSSPGHRGHGSAAPPTARATAGSWVVPREEWPSYAAGSRLVIPISIASLDLPRTPTPEKTAGRQIAFVAEVQEGKRWRSAPAGPVTITLCDAPGAPDGVEAKSAPGGVLVSWNSQGAPAAPSAPAASRTTGSPAQIYRAEGEAEIGDKPFHTLPAGATSFLDEAAVMGVAYRYEVRLGRAEDPNRCESEAGAEAKTTRVDTFPPSRPVGLAAAAEDALIRLFWTPSPENDVAGYLVYRSDGPGSPFHLVTPSPILPTTYADTDVKKRTRYTYAVSAVDTAQPQNESARSEPAEESLP